MDTELSELNRILSLFKKKDARNTCMVELALNTGARASELLNIRWMDLDTTEKTVFIKGLKGSNDREIPIQPDLYERIKKLKNPEALLKDSVFNISYPRLIQIWNDYKPVNKKFHSLRHTFALNLYKKTRDLRLVQVALGHRNIQNTIVYAEYVYSTEELRKLIL
ncbi:MAG: tyrosine-type recombinase/integrase [Bdellovibrionales bacterium]